MAVRSSLDDTQRNEIHPPHDVTAPRPKAKGSTLFCKVQGAMRHVPDFVETCKGILDAVMEEMDAENCSLMLKDPVSGELAVRAARGKHEGESVYFFDDSATGKRFKPGEGIAGWVMKEGRAAIVNDVKEEPRFVKTAGLNGKVNSLICFPVLEKDQVVGVFNMSHSRKGAFSEGDKMALAYISNQVGAALTSARFFLDTQEITRLMKESVETSVKEKPVAVSSRRSSTFVEVGEVSQGNGIFIYVSEKMHRIKRMIDQVANTDVTVLIQGESGVGKEIVARSIHLNSLRREKPFIKVNCAALPEELLESELFGYEKGAFTGAYRSKPGKFELADGGTIFLDEIAEISPTLQAKLLQVLQDREFSRLGGERDVRVDVRILVATNKNIDDAVRNGSFREDLYYRLNVVNITVPPLRDRKEEIPVFVEYFIDKYGTKFQKEMKPLSERAIKLLAQHDWMGNVRELENVIQRFVILGTEDAFEGLTSAVSRKVPEKTVPLDDGPASEKGWPPLKEVHRDAIVKTESEAIRRALEVVHWNRKKAAGLLNISYKALLYKMKSYGIATADEE